jgi:hypothetical protein
MGLSADDKLLLERIEDDFSWHTLPPEQAQKYEALRAHTKALARLIAELCPDGRERSIALTKLEEVAMWSNAGIERHR